MLKSPSIITGRVDIDASVNSISMSPTSDDELQHLNCIIDNGISDFKEQGMFSTPDLIHKSILQLKKSKDDGNVGFKSDHLINGGDCQHVFLSILFNVMITHGYNARDLRISSILSIPKDMKSSLTSSEHQSLWRHCTVHTCFV